MLANCYMRLTVRRHLCSQIEFPRQSLCLIAKHAERGVAWRIDSRADGHQSKRRKVGYSCDRRTKKLKSIHPTRDQKTTELLEELAALFAVVAVHS